MLNRDVKQFGKKHMFDSNEETCWNSDQVGARGRGRMEDGWTGIYGPLSPLTRYHICPQGSCQWVTLDFPRTVRVSQLHIQFQGGFSSRLCTLEGEGLLGMLVLCLPLCPWGVWGLCLLQPTEPHCTSTQLFPSPSQAAEQVKNW